MNATSPRPTWRVHFLDFEFRGSVYVKTLFSA
jgi:hypothetical protein